MIYESIAFGCSRFYVGTFDRPKVAQDCRCAMDPAANLCFSGVSIPYHAQTTLLVMNVRSRHTSTTFFPL